MKKRIFITLFLALLSGLLWAAPLPKGPAQAQITFHVVTDEGKPVEGIQVLAKMFSHWQSGEAFGKDIYEEKPGITGSNGNVTFSFASERGDCGYAIFNVPGYYDNRGLRYNFKEVEKGQWQPWNPTVEVVAKPILNPVPMYARRVGILTAAAIPAINTPVGFDLMESDWVAPYGKGKDSDLIFRLDLDRLHPDRGEPFDATLTITFSKEGDGIQSSFIQPFFGSALKLPRFAPEDGYVPKLTKQLSRAAVGKPVKNDVRDDQNYFFRVRTVKEQDQEGKAGKIISAYYGKIDGNIEFWENGKMRFTYYLNPTANDRNMEFDPKRNLLKGISRLERPNAP